MKEVEHRGLMTPLLTTTTKDSNSNNLIIDPDPGLGYAVALLRDYTATLSAKLN